MELKSAPSPWTAAVTQAIPTWNATCSPVSSGACAAVPTEDTPVGFLRCPFGTEGSKPQSPFQQSLSAGPSAELVLKRAASMASFDRRSAVLATLRRGLLIRGWRLTQPRREAPSATRTFRAELRAVAPIRRCLVAFSACLHTERGTGGHGGVSCGAREDTDLELSRGEKAESESTQPFS